MKPGPIALMIGLLLLALWLVAGPALLEQSRGATPGARVVPVESGTIKLRYEVFTDESGREMARFLTQGEGLPQEAMERAEFERILFATLTEREPRHPVLIALNVTSWWNVWWVVIGFAGQVAFFLRMTVQWVVSERQKKSVVPPVFWWLSLAGALMIFSYFVWRKDIVGVVGQSMGVVIYARNLRLIYKERRRARRREASREEGGPVAA